MKISLRKHALRAIALAVVVAGAASADPVAAAAETSCNPSTWCQAWCNGSEESTCHNGFGCFGVTCQSDYIRCGLFGVRVDCGGGAY